MTSKKTRCKACRTDVAVPEFTMAFQPIVDIETADVYAYESLCVLSGAVVPMTS